MSQYTRRQHYVPDFYLSLWANASGHITCHDRVKGSEFSCDPKNALAQSYFYEEDPSNPDNRVEKTLSAMEGACSVTFKKLVQSHPTVGGSMGDIVAGPKRPIRN